ncbi:MAG: T9SS type A sorting domain-containing protein [Cytophagales bacterium]|nr:T9SS type A sorting domain-containing protein [Cytophagales bacterium]
MKKIILPVIYFLISVSIHAQDWKDFPVPVSAGIGMEWELQNSSDDFNDVADPTSKSEEFSEKWTDFYHNAWTGPGLTIWDRGHSFVNDGNLQIIVNRAGTNKINTGCITSKQRVKYPVYIEARARIMNAVLANAVWLLSPDDTQEIDILEAYGSSYSENAQKDQTWFAERIHVSHHVFIRQPFQDYQPKDAGSWYYDGTLWRNDYHTYGVYWIDPWNLEYYIDGKLIRKVSGKEIIDPLNYTNGTGLSKEMDIIINVEDQNWRSDQGITPTDKELENKGDHTFKVDWIRVYKPVKSTVTSSKEKQKEVLFFPNPTTDSLSIRTEKELKQVEIFNLNGQKIKMFNSSNLSAKLNVSDLKNGLYLLKVSFVDQTEAFHKFSIQR